MLENISKPQWEQNLLSMAKEVFTSEVHIDYPVAHHKETHLVATAYAACEQITAQHSRSFHIASGLLPFEKRRAVRALYAFCRVADDIVDEGEEPRGLALKKYKSTTLSPRPSAEDPVAMAWADTRAAYRIPLGYSVQLLDGIERDLYQPRYSSFGDLAIYCYGVASTVGLMSMYIIGFENVKAVQYAIKLGVALQLTNVLRDIGEDWRAGRMYLPLEELDAFGLKESHIADGKVNDPWREFMRFQIDRNRRLYKEALPGIRLLNREGRLAVASAARLYQGILDDIELHDYDVFSRRAYVKGSQKVIHLLHAYQEAKHQ